MGFKAFRGHSFNHSHENKVFNTLYDLLRQQWEGSDESLYLLGNFFVAGREFDALILKNNAIIVVDFKNYGGVLTFSENGPWLCDGVEVKGGSSRNPFMQIRENKFSLLKYLENLLSNIPSSPNLGHITGLALFHQDIIVNEQQISPKIKSWFHICDLNTTIRTIDAIASKEINLSLEEIDIIAKSFSLDEYFPDGKVTKRSIDVNNEDLIDDDFKPTASQRKVLKELDEWLNSTDSTFILEGMVSTGKRTILQRFLHEAANKNINLLLIAPNARFAKKYNKNIILPQKEFGSIYQIIYSSKSNEQIKKSNGIELAKYPVILTAEDIKDKLIVIVEAHFISNSYHDTDNFIFGSGHMVSDFLTACGDTPPKLLIIGDPYQLSRGDIDQSLLFAKALKDKGLSVKESSLVDQIETEPKEIHEFQFQIANKMQKGQFNSLPILGDGFITAINEDPQIGLDITNADCSTVYLTAVNDIANKINLEAKRKILKQQDPSILNVGDLIDFHTGTPIITLNDHDNINETIERISAGEIAVVTHVDSRIVSRELQLKGRDTPTCVRIGYLKCKRLKSEEFTIAYLIDYLHSDRPQLSQDQVLVLTIAARQDAEYAYKVQKNRLDNIKDKKSQEYKSEKQSYNYNIQEHISNSFWLTAAKIRYAYAMTVHRAQGRSWKRVYLTARRAPSGSAITNDGYFRFLYTASTCAEEELKILHYPKLTPLSEAVFSSSKNYKISPYKITRGFNYQILGELDLAKITYPEGFNLTSIELKSLYFCVLKQINNSNWTIKEVRQYNYQEQYIFRHNLGKELKVRFHYNKDFIVNSLSFPEDPDNVKLENEVLNLLNLPIVLKDQRFNEALIALEKFLNEYQFIVAHAQERSANEMKVDITNGEEAVTLKVFVGNDGLISTISPEKATSHDVIDLLKGIINGK